MPKGKRVKPKKLKKGDSAVAFSRLKQERAKAKKVMPLSKVLNVMAGKPPVPALAAAEREFKRSKSRSRRPKHK